MAPEQLEGRKVDGRVDVYALGCVLYQALTGRVPYPRDTEHAKMWAHMTEPPPRPGAVAPDLPPGFDEVVARAMAKRPDDRYATAGELGAAAVAAAQQATGRSWGADRTLDIPRQAVRPAHGGRRRCGRGRRCSGPQSSGPQWSGPAPPAAVAPGGGTRAPRRPLPPTIRAFPDGAPSGPSHAPAGVPGPQWGQADLGPGERRVERAARLAGAGPQWGPQPFVGERLGRARAAVVPVGAAAARARPAQQLADGRADARGRAGPGRGGHRRGAAAAPDRRAAGVAPSPIRPP